MKTMIAFFRNSPSYPKIVMLNLFQHLKGIPKQVRDDSGGETMLRFGRGVILALLLVLTSMTPLAATELSEILALKPLGKNIGKWQASELVSDYIMGRFFTLPSDRKKMWQLRFFTFEDRENILKKKNSFADFVKKFGLEKLQSKEDAMPYNDGTFRSFTDKDANEFLVAKGKPPLPEGIFFILSFREIFMKTDKNEKQERP